MIHHEEYGRALLLVAIERGRLTQMKADIETALAVLDRHPEYVKLMDSPALPKKEKLELIERAFGTLERDLISFVKILVERRSLYLFPRAAAAFFCLCDEHEGILRAEVVSAVPLTEGQTRALVAALARKTGKRIRLESRVDPAVLGGMIVRYGGVQMDGTLSVRLEKLGDALSGAIV